MENHSRREHTPIHAAAHVLFALARRLRAAGWSRVRALHAALGLYLTLGLVVAGLALWGFAALTDEVVQGDTLTFDREVLQWLAAHRSDLLTRVAIEATALGSMPVAGVLALTLTVILSHLRRRRHVILIWSAWVGSILLNAGLKDVFDRPRPAIVEPLVVVGSHSFPSGHAMNSMVFYTVATYVVGHLIGAGWPRRLTYLVGLVLVLSIGLTRLYLGVHFPSDVVAGYAIGYAWAMTCAVFAEAWGRGIFRRAS